MIYLAMLTLTASITATNNSLSFFLFHPTAYTDETTQEEQLIKKTFHVRLSQESLDNLIKVEQSIRTKCIHSGVCQTIDYRKSPETYRYSLTVENSVQVLKPDNDIPVMLNLDFLKDDFLHQWHVSRFDSYTLHHFRIVELSGSLGERHLARSGDSFIRYSHSGIELAEFHTPKRIYRLYPKHLKLTCQDKCINRTYIIDVETKIP